MAFFSQTNPYNSGPIISNNTNMHTISMRKKSEKYSFEDGTATFWVEDTEFCVHKYFFTRDSKKISELLGLNPNMPISLENTTAIDFERFLEILYPNDFERHAANTAEKWASVLMFADTWGFESIRKLAVSKLGEIGTAIDKIVYGKKFGVTGWLEDAYKEVCERSAPITEEEGERVGMTDVVKIASTREKFLRDKFTFNRVNTIRSVFNLLSPAKPVEQNENKQAPTGVLPAPVFAKAQSDSENEPLLDVPSSTYPSFTTPAGSISRIAPTSFEVAMPVTESSSMIERGDLSPQPEAPMESPHVEISPWEVRAREHTIEDTPLELSAPANYKDDSVSGSSGTRNIKKKKKTSSYKAPLGFYD